MVVLFTIAMVCFFALFGMMVILLRQAKAEGALEGRRRDRKDVKAHRSARLASSQAFVGVAQNGLDISLSNLVPKKQADWRFMVRGVGFNHSERKKPDSARYDVDRGDMTLSNNGVEDTTASQGRNIARRA